MRVLKTFPRYGSLTMAFLGKFAYLHIWLTILSCYSSIPVPYSSWERWWFEHCIIVAGGSLLFTARTFGNVVSKFWCKSVTECTFLIQNILKLLF